MPFVHDVWQTEDGLPHNAVKAIVQSAEGYLWLGSAVGLVRFDGMRFVTVAPPGLAAIQNTHIWALLEDANGGLWIGAGDGLGYLRDGNARVYTTADGLSNAFVRALHEDRNGTLWIGTYGGGLNRLSDSTFTAFTTREGLPTNFINTLYETRDGRLWIGTNGGLSVFHRGRFETFTLPGGPAANDVRALFEHEDGALWVGTGAGLMRYQAGTFRPATAVTGSVRTIFEDTNGALWVGTETQGVFQLERRRRQQYSTANDLSHNDVRALFQDREGSVWVGTNGGGLNRFKPGRFVVYGTEEGLPSNGTFSIFQDSQGVIWIGTSGGLARLAANTFTTLTTEAGLSSNVVFSLAEDTTGALWVGTNGGGLNRYQQGRFTRFTTTDGLADDVIFSLYVDPQGALWVGTGEGLNLYENGRFVLIPGTDGLVVSLWQTQDEHLWIATNTGLLRRTPEGTVTRFTTADGLSSNAVRALYEDADGTLWIGTRGGLNHYDDGRFTYVTEQDGLFDNVVYHIREDPSGYFWLSGEKGLSRVRKREVAARMAGTAAGFQADAYGKADGMRNSALSGGTQPAGWQTHDGRLWFPTLGGVVVVDPTDIHPNTLPPPVHIEAFQVEDEAQSLADGLRLPPGPSRFTFSYTALSLLAPEQVQFRYQLSPRDEDWIEAGTQRMATYTNLAPGTYTFRVRASNNDGLWNEEGAALTFTLRPFFYQTPWFWAACTLLLVGLIFGGYRWRIRSLKQREQELVRLVEARTRSLAAAKEQTEAQARQLEAQAEKLVALDEAKSRFFANISHEFRTPLTLILGPLNDLLARKHGPLPEAIQQTLTTSRTNAQRLLDLINQLLDLSKLEAGKMHHQPVAGDLRPFLERLVGSFAGFADRRQLTLRFASPAPTLPATYDPDMLEKVVSNLLSNALKFTEPGGKVLVTARPADANLHLSVKDTGCGIPAPDLPHIFDRFHQAHAPEQHPGGTGIGLALCKELVELHGGAISVASEYGFGTTFTVVLPVLESAAHGQQGETALPAATLPLPNGEIGGTGGKRNPQNGAVSLQSGERSLHDPTTPPSEAASPQGEHGSSSLANRPNGSGAAEAGATEAETPSARGPLTVLLVEDHPEVRAYLRTHLEATYAILEAQNGAEGLALAQQHHPALIVSDVMMPVMDGYELCRTLKADATTADIPIILLTAHASEEGTLEGLDVGADAYVAKPFHLPELEARIRNLIAVRHELRAQYSREIVIQPTDVVVPSTEEAFLEQAIAVVEHHLGRSSFNIDTLADEVGLSRRQLQRRLKAATGQSPKAFVRHIRLERAAQLLRQESGTIAEIAYAVGFSKPSYFAERFREQYGVLPSAYAAEVAS